MEVHASRKTNLGIQSLRGIAVGSVVLYHFAPSYFQNGFLGVDLFFVISGYLIIPRIYLTLENSKPSYALKAFLIRRLRRLLPTHATTLLITMFAVFFLSKPSEHRLVAAQAIASQFLLANHGAQVFVGDYFNHGRNSLLHLWSLSVEEQIYLFFPIMLLLLEAIRRRVYKLLLLRHKSSSFFFLFWLIITSVFSFLTSFFSRLFGFPFERSFMGFPSETVFYSVFSRFWEFGVGGLLAFTMLRVGPRNLNLKFIKIVCFALLSAWLLSSSVGLAPTIRIWAELITVVLSVLSIALFEFKDINRDLIFGPLIWIGEISYPLYLIHFPILLIARYSPLSVFDENREIVRWTSLMLSFVAAFLLHRRIEYSYISNGYENVEFSIMNFLAKFLFPPLFLGLAILGLSEHRYFGYDPNPPHLQDAGELDPNCSRDGNSQPCIYGKGLPIYLLIGDSQARANSQAFVDYVERNSGTAYVWTKAGCPFLLPSASKMLLNDKALYAMGVPGKSSASCFNHNRKVLSFVKKMNVDYIFLSQRSSSRFFQDFGVSQADFNQASIQSVYVLSNKEYLRKLYWIGPNLEFPDSNYFFSGNLLIWQEKYVAPRTFSRKEMSSFTFQDEIFIKREIQGSNKIQFFPTSKVFCQNQYCFRWKKSWLFMDMDHLSQRGARFLFGKVFESKNRNLHITIK
jgi:peptidoglycan/LPS O-acetylase OafA/YrhL